MVEMKRLALMILAIASCMLTAMAGVARASAQLPAVASISDIVQKPTQMNGQEVRIVGEAIGDLMVRGDYAWINVLDKTGMAIGVYLPKGEALKIRNLGRYSQTGDTVDLVGVFNNACVEHGGDPDIHSTSLVVVAQGIPTPHPVDTLRLIFAGVLLAVAAVMGVAVKRRGSESEAR